MAGKAGARKRRHAESASDATAHDPASRGVGEEEDENIPDGFVCSISQEVMVDPVMLVESGISYERSEILKWLKGEKQQGRLPVCPSTKIACPSLQVKDNVNLRKAIQSWKDIKHRNRQLLRAAGILDERKLERDADSIGILRLPPSGTKRNQFRSPRPFTTPPHISPDGSAIFACALNKTVCKVCSSDCTLVWEAKTGNIVFHMAVSIDSSHVLLSANGLLKLRTSDGQEEGDIMSGCSSSHMSTSRDERFLFHIGPQQTLDKCASSDGKQLWRFAPPGGMDALPCESSDCACLFVTTMKGHCYKLNNFDGQTLWSSSLPTPCTMCCAPVLSHDGAHVYACSETAVHKLRADDGSEVWRFTASEELTMPVQVTLDGRFLVCGCAAGKVYGVRAEDGELEWEVQMAGESVGGCLSRGDRHLYVGCSKRAVAKLRMEDGAKEWQFETEGDIKGAPALGKDGLHLYVFDHNSVYQLVA